MIQIYCGEGKGKTSAAVGASVRAAGAGMKVWFCQFMKGNMSGEISILKGLEQITVCRLSKAYPFYSEMNEADQAEIRREHDAMLGRLMEIPDSANTMMVLDELTYPVKFHLVDEGLVRSFLRMKKETQLIITGRDPWKEVLDQAECITECRKIRHHFDQGINAKKGIEY